LSALNAKDVWWKEREKRRKEGTLNRKETRELGTKDYEI
jgi:hypothetical protein